MLSFLEDKEICGEGRILTLSQRRGVLCLLTDSVSQQSIDVESPCLPVSGEMHFPAVCESRRRRVSRARDESQSKIRAGEGPLVVSWFSTVFICSPLPYP